MNGDMNNTNINNGGQIPASSPLPVQPSIATPVAVVGQQSPTVSTKTTSGGANQILCDKCGEYYNEKQRYCMKCGALNYNHPDNQSMKQYINYDVVNSGYVENGGSKLSGGIIDPYQKKKRNCLIVSIIITLFPFASIIALLLIFGALGVGTGLIPFIAMTVGAYLFMLLMNYSNAMIFLKAGENWWANYIPLYSNFIFFKITLDSGWFILLLFIPGINLLVSGYANFKLGKRFGRSGLLTLFLPFIMRPVIGLSGNSYAGSLRSMHMSLGDSEVDSKGRTVTEREYHTKKVFVILGVLIAGIVALIFTFPYIMKYAPYVIDFFVKKFHEFMEVIEKMN